MLQPRKVLICGSAVLHAGLKDFGQELGRALMEKTPFTLMTGGLHYLEGKAIAHDYVVATAAEKQIRLAGEDPSTRIHTILPEKNPEVTHRFICGRVVVVPYTNLRARRESMVVKCDALISVGGQKTTRTMIDLAWVSDKPILPIPATGGASLKAWEDYRKEIGGRLHITENDMKDFEALEVSDERLVPLIVRILCRAVSPVCFVAMPFNHPLQGFMKTVRVVAEEKGYNAFRVDEVKEVDSIPKAISDGIRGAQVVVADLTMRNPNVFYEIGMAHTLQKTMLLTVFSRSGKVPTRLPFDIRHCRVLPYESLKSFKAHLQEYLPSI